MSTKIEGASGGGGGGGTNTNVHAALSGRYTNKIIFIIYYYIELMTNATRDFHDRPEASFNVTLKFTLIKKTFLK